MCLEKGLVVDDSVFKKKKIHKYSWMRVADGRDVDRSLVVFVLILS